MCSAAKYFEMDTTKLSSSLVGLLANDLKSA